MNLAAADETQDRALAILRDHCLACHSKPTIMSGLDLSTRESSLKGGQRGPALVPGRAGDSRLYQAVRRTTPLAMPPTKPLAEADIEVLRQWIDAGATWALSKASSAPASTWWAFQRPVRPEVPTSGQTWSRNAIDEFVFKKLAENGLKPAPPANRPTLLRRLYYDLTGLPPTAEAQVFSLVPAIRVLHWTSLCLKRVRDRGQRTSTFRVWNGWTWAATPRPGFCFRL